MDIKFTKMQGCGNDYVYINGFTEHVPEEEKAEIVKYLSDRHFGIGSDGVIFINPSEIADFEMQMFNADGTRAEMCGNGIRCVAKYVYDNKMTDSRDITIESFGKIKGISIFEKDGKAHTVRVDMGEPVLKPSEIPVNSGADSFINENIVSGDREYAVTAVSMGNPHAVIFEDPDTVGIEKAGPLMEHNSLFPKRTNVEYVKVLDRSHIILRVWERGTGETLACGTGCCASVVACILNGRTDRKVNVKVLGGEIDVEWSEEDNHVYMTGPAETVFTGSVTILGKVQKGDCRNA